jgi:hypothetical protein
MRRGWAQQRWSPPPRLGVVWTQGPHSYAHIATASYAHIATTSSYAHIGLISSSYAHIATTASYAHIHSYTTNSFICSQGPHSYAHIATFICSHSYHIHMLT